MNVVMMAAIWVAAGAGAPGPLVAGAPSSPRVMVGVRPPGQGCPPPARGWSLGPARAEPLDRFCEYIESSNAGALPVDPDDPDPPCTEPIACGPIEGLSEAGLGEVKPQSGEALATQSPDGWDTYVSASMSASLRTSFLRQIEAPGEPLAPASAPRPTLALVDTLSPLARNPSSRHGPTLRALAEGLARRRSGPPAVEIEAYLALPRTRGGVPDYIEGGFYGTLWDLAQAIAAAVRDARAVSQPRLVLNLSLGWDPYGQPSLPAAHLSLIQGSSGLPGPLRAVHAAVVYARCSGALIYAASGNDELGLGDRTNALLPAGWMVYTGPTATECQSLWAGAASVGATTGAPLVYAVGGTGNDDRVVPNARPRSTPVLVAAAEGVPPPVPGRIMTGTSVATLVASTTAALVWAIEPNARADAVHTRVQGAARPLGWRADTCPGLSICPLARSVSVCAAQRDACRGQGGTRCPSLQCTPPGPHNWPFSMFLAGGLAALNKSGSPTPIAFGAPSPIPGCGLVRLPSFSKGPPSPCPTDELPAARHLDSSPQPVDPMCPACFIDATPSVVTFVIDVLPEVPGGWLHEPYVQLSDGQGNTDRYALPGPIPQGYTGVLQLFPGFPSPVKEAWLQYQLDVPEGPFSAAEPLISQ